MDSKQKGRSLFSLGGKTQSLEGQNQIPTRLLQLASTKEKKDKKKKKSKSQPPQDAGKHTLIQYRNNDKELIQLACKPQPLYPFWLESVICTYCINAGLSELCVMH